MRTKNTKVMNVQLEVIDENTNHDIVFHLIISGCTDTHTTDMDDRVQREIYGPRFQCDCECTYLHHWHNQHNTRIKSPFEKDEMTNHKAHPKGRDIK